MKTKRFLIFRNIFFILMALVLVGGLTATGLFSTARHSPAELRVTNLVISPTEVHAGEKTAIFAEVTNNGDSDDTHTIVLTLNNSNGEEVERNEEEVPVPAGETTTVEFTLTIAVPDTYEIEVDGLSGTLNVMERPAGAEFRVTNLTISPPEVKVGEKVTVAAYVQNIGQTDGTHTLILKINGEETEEGKTEVPVVAGETTTVEFTLAINVAGTYEIEVDGEGGLLEVTPAEEPTPEATPQE